MKTRGIHWIVTTHGTWLHGDVRGSWLRGKLVGPDPFHEAAVRARMSAGEVVLSKAEQILVACEFGRAAREKRWTVWAATVQATHAHVIFAPLYDPVDEVIAMMKYRAACAVLGLRRQMRLETGDALWTEGPFAVFMFDDDHVSNAIAYVRRHNRAVGRADDPYEWIDAPFPSAPARKRVSRPRRSRR